MPPCQAEVRTLAPNSAMWSEFIGTRLDELADLFASAYQGNDRGAALHSSRVMHAKPWLFVVEDSVGALIAASYVFRAGRRAASAVLPTHRLHGHYSAMLAESLRDVPDQFTEIATRTGRQRRALTNAGFRVENDWNAVRLLLGPLLIPLVRRKWVENGELRYERMSFDSDQVLQFSLLTHGTPRPVIQSSPYYKRGLE